MEVMTPKLEPKLGAEQKAIGIRHRQEKAQAGSTVDAAESNKVASPVIL